MKVAILGSASHAYKMAEILSQMEAYPTLFLEEMPSAIRELPAGVIAYENIKILGVGKKFLRKGQAPLVPAGVESNLGQSRFMDLFNVHYERQYQGEPREHQEVFDLVIDSRGKGGKMGLSGAYALNERFHESKIHYGFIPHFETWGSDVLIVANASHFWNLLEVYEDYFENTTPLRWPNFHFVWDQQTAQAKTMTPSLLEQEFYCTPFAQKIKMKETLWFDEQVRMFHEALRVWRELEDYEKVKVSKPESPERKLKLYHGATVTAADYFEDRNHFVITLERPDFKGLPFMKSLPINTVACFNPDEYKNCHLLQEVGFWELTGPDKISPMIEDILQLFSRV